MLKSAVLFSKKPLHFYIFAEDDLHDSFKNAVRVLYTVCNIINLSYHMQFIEDFHLLCGYPP